MAIYRFSLQMELIYVLRSPGGGGGGGGGGQNIHRLTSLQFFLGPVSRSLQTGSIVLFYDGHQKK